MTHGLGVAVSRVMSSKKRKADVDAPAAKSKSKKAKSEGKDAKPTPSEPVFDLGSKRRVTVKSWKGKTLVDIREFYGDEDDLKPGSKGISLSLDQWKALKGFMDKVDEAVATLED